MRFLIIVLTLPLLNLLWWWWADRKLRRFPHALLWRVMLTAFVLVQFGCFVYIFLSRFQGWPQITTVPLIGTVYVWHLLGLPFSIVILALSLAIGIVSRAMGGAEKGLERSDADPPAPDPAPVGTMSRRSFLFTTAAVSLPPLVTGLGVAKGLSELSKFRIRRFTVSIPGLPSALEGLTIAHLSDTHVGHFTPARALPAIADATNELNADLILFTGDLIDFAIADLPRAMDFLKQLHHPDRLFLCEGNHDLFESRDRFENDLKDAGFNLLLNEAPVVGVRGHPVQILGLQWGLAPSRRSANIEQHFMQALSLRNLQAFPILLAHHPHAFDLAAEVGIPLTLAGHTHGGQLMLTETIGPGPMMFKYYSGLYRKGNSSLVVSNGTGNWFPLRLNAPAEIVHLTLVGGSSANG